MKGKLTHLIAKTGFAVLAATFIPITCHALAEVPAPIAWWRMDSVNQQGRISDASGNGHDLVLGPDVSVQNDAFLGNVLRFEGTVGSWAKTVDGMSVGSRSISAWLYREEGVGPLGLDVNTRPYLLNSFSGSGVNWPGGGLGITCFVDGNIAYEGIASVRGKWHHYVWTIDVVGVSDGVCTYHHTVVVNGGEAVRAASNLTAVAANVVDLEQAVMVGNIEEGGNRPVYGMVGDMRLFDRALTPDEARELYLGTLHNRPAHVVGFWRMDSESVNGAGERVVAAEDGGADMVLGQGNVLTVNGISGKALSYPDSANSYAFVTNNLPVTDITISMWIKPWLGMSGIASSSVGNTLPHLFTLIGGGNEYFRLCFNEREDYGFRRFAVCDMATVDDPSSASYLTDNIYMEKGVWTHVAFVAKTERKADGSYFTKPKFYCNGNLVTEGRESACTAFAKKGEYPANLKLVLGNRSYPSNRAFWGEIDDVVFISGALDADGVKNLFRGVPAVSAGDDFSTVRPSVRLAGAIGVRQSGDCGRPAAPSSVSWRLISAPQGASPVIANARDLCTAVTLPAVGDYVFRLTAVSAGVAAFDDVTISRVSEMGGGVPSVSVAGASQAYTGIPCALSAEITGASARIEWRRVAGPNAVLFSPRFGGQTSATFYEAGTYVIRAVADSGQSASVAEAEIVVTNPNVDLANGLMAYAQFRDVACASTVGDLTPWTYYFDRNNIKLASGVEDYAIQVAAPFNYSFIMLHGNGAGWTLDETDADGRTESSSRVTNPWRAFSAWLLYDPASDTNSAYRSVVFEQPFNLGLMYDRENGKDRFRMYQNNGGACSGTDGMDLYELNGVDMANRWTHVYALFDRTNSYTGNLSELWIDGVKQTPLTKYMGYGRPRNGYLELGGIKATSGTAGFNNHYADQSGNMLSRTFPGRIDEFRMYSRSLTEAEIKTLAANPVSGVNNPPASESFVAVDGVTAGKTISVTGLAADDAMPPASTLTYEWKVLSGDASSVTFGSKYSKSTTFSARKKGPYVICLAVSDGESVTYSDPLRLDVFAPGFVITLQ